MPSYSSKEFYADWRYALKRDFSTSSDQPYPYANNGYLQWGKEVRKLIFNKAAHLGSITDDGKRLALAIENDIHVLDTETWDTIAVLRGHSSRVNAIAFRPDDTNKLVSGETADHRNMDVVSPPMIIFWNLEEECMQQPSSNGPYDDAAHAAAITVAQKLADLGLSLSDDEIQGLKTDIQPAVNRAAARNMAARHATIIGRLLHSSKSRVFSPSGKWLAYLPGKAPRSNRDDPWDIQILSTDGHEKKFLLQGHTDAIMWTGWSPDESLFASISWDHSIRIWDAHTGDQRHCFMTESQNWTGGFSADMSYFVATDGQGNVRVYSLPSGELHWMYEGGRGLGWRRAISWHPNNQWLAVGGERLGELLLLDVVEKKLLQQRLLSTEACTREEEYRRMMERSTGVDKVQFLDSGNKLAVRTYGDESIELYDMQEEVKWRFPRGGTDDGPDADKWRDEKGKVTSKGGHGMLGWESRSKGVLQMASIDFDAVRIWEVPLTS
ncbi:hypothetical protein ACLX1H_000791 [Fusarium chlamydosporum]